MVQPPATPPPGSKHGTHQQTARHRQQPEAPVVHAREGHVRRADHQGHLPVREAGEGRHDHAEDHDQPVQGGELVEQFRLHDLQAGLEQFGPDQHGHEAADQEHGGGEPQVEGADVLVVGGLDLLRVQARAQLAGFIAGLGKCAEERDILSHVFVLPFPLVTGDADGHFRVAGVFDADQRRG
jgi:hypothetical protein